MAVYKKWRVCWECGKEFYGVPKAMFCSPECQRNTTKIKEGRNQEELDMIQRFLKKNYGKEFRKTQEKMLSSGWNMHDYGKWQKQKTIQLIREGKL